MHVCAVLQLRVNLYCVLDNSLQKQKAAVIQIRVFLVQFNIFQFYRPDSLFSFPSADSCVRRESEQFPDQNVSFTQI